jgi:hypothetical protein
VAKPHNPPVAEATEVWAHSVGVISRNPFTAGSNPISPDDLRNSSLPTGPGLYYFLTYLSVQAALVGNNLDVRTVRDDLALRLKFEVLLGGVLGEAPLSGNNNALLTRELELGAAKSLHSGGDSLLSATNGDQDLTDVNTGGNTVGLAESTTHTGLQSISTGARKHLVDAENVEGVNTNTAVERILLADLGHVLVDANTSGFKSFRGELFAFQRNHVNTLRELINCGLLLAQIEDSNT